MMPRVVEINGVDWECPECGTDNQVCYDGCCECDIEVELKAVQKNNKEASPPTLTNKAMSEINSLITGAIECLESSNDKRLAIFKLREAEQLTSS